MSDAPKKMVIGSMIVAGIVALAAVADLVIGVPFTGTSDSKLMDILFIVAAAIVGYLSWDAYRDLR